MKLLLSHVADLDGITPIILLNLLNIDFEYELFDVNKLDKFIVDRIDTDYFSRFDEIILAFSLIDSVKFSLSLFN